MALKRKFYHNGRWRIMTFFISMVFLCFQPAKLKAGANKETSKVEKGCEKGTSYKTLWQWSEPIENPAHLSGPHCICLDGDGNLLIAHTGVSRIMRFTPKGTYLSDLGKGFGSENGYFDKPRDVAMDSKGNFVVADQKSEKDRIQVFDPKGIFLRSFANEGSGKGQISWPHGLAFDSKNRILVIDAGNNRVNLYKQSGKFVKALGQNGPNVKELVTPHGLCVDPDDGVFISDYYGTVQKFTIDGDYLFSFKTEIHSEGSAFIHSICSDLDGNVYLMVRGIKGFEGTYEESKVEDRSFYIAKYNNEGEHVNTILLSNDAREVLHATVNPEGKIYALFVGGGRMGVEVLGKD